VGGTLFVRGKKGGEGRGKSESPEAGAPDKRRGGGARPGKEYSKLIENKETRK